MNHTSDHPRLELDAWLAAGDYLATPDGHRVF